VKAKAMKIFSTFTALAFAVVLSCVEGRIGSVNDEIAGTSNENLNTLQERTLISMPTPTNHPSFTTSIAKIFDLLSTKINDFVENKRSQSAASEDAPEERRLEHPFVDYCRYLGERYDHGERVYHLSLIHI